MPPIDCASKLAAVLTYLAICCAPCFSRLLALDAMLASGPDNGFVGRLRFAGRFLWHVWPEHINLTTCTTLYCMHGEELRKEPRILVQDLPEEYARFNVLLAQGKEAAVDTIDASANGFGFFSDLPKEEFILGGRIVLYPVGSEVPVYGQIVHTAVTDKGTRVGVRLLQVGGYKLYNATIKKLLAALTG